MDARLLACAGLVRGERCADVGTDHGYLPIYLVNEGICRSAAACDINEKPLASARANIIKAGLSDRIDFYLSNGLDSVPEDGITDVVIAGMGGELIADIIDRAPWIKTRRVNLVLQPMTKWDHLRRYLYDNRFEVTSETPCQSGKFVYSALQAVYTGEMQDVVCDLSYLYYGTVTPDTADGIAYLSRQAKRLDTIGKALLGDPDRSDEAELYLSAAGKWKHLIG